MRTPIAGALLVMLCLPLALRPAAASAQPATLGEGSRLLEEAAEGLSTPASVPSPTDEPLGGVWGSSIDDVWIVGRRELILRGSIR